MKRETAVKVYMLLQKIEKLQNEQEKFPCSFDEEIEIKIYNVYREEIEKLEKELDNL